MKSVALPKLDISREFSALRARFESDLTQQTFNALVCGEIGSGKTTLLSTCRKPVVVDSFDKGGSKSLRKWIKEGSILVDTRWEAEDREDPTIYEAWAKEMNRRFAGGFFDTIGTYSIDSCTSWTEVIMNYDLKKSDNKGGVPSSYDKHWGPQKNKIINHLMKILGLPCDFILTGHLAPTFRDKAREQLEGYRLLITGDLTTKVPLLFDEVYVTKVSSTSKGLKYGLLTAATGTYIARSRLAANADFKAVEEPDIKRLLKKAGLPTTDKPWEVT